MNKEFAELPEEFGSVEEFELRQNKEINIIPEEFPKEKEFTFDQEFNSDVVSTDSDGNSATSLKDTYTKALKVLKLATTVSLAATTMSVSLPKIVPIITIDATEEESQTEADEDKTVVSELSGEWGLSSVRKTIIRDGQEIEDTSETVTSAITSFSIEDDSGRLYLSAYEDGKLLTTTLLEEDDKGNYFCHLNKQSGEESDIEVYRDGEFLVVKETVQVRSDDGDYETVTYNYCTKGSATYVVNKTPGEEIETAAAQEICPECDGTGKIKCDVCDKSGVVVCEECKGSGYLEMTCAKCNGSGECATCRGSGVIENTANEELGAEEVEAESTCPDCGGNGICASCNGSGKEKCPTCNGDGANNTPGYVTCTNCEGSGEVNCPECDGSGKVAETKEDNESESGTSPAEETGDNNESVE